MRIEDYVGLMLSAFTRSLQQICYNNIAFFLASNTFNF